VLAKLLYTSPAWWGMPPLPIISTSKHLSAEVFDSVRMARVIQLLLNLPRTPTKDYSWELSTMFPSRCQQLQLQSPARWWQLRFSYKNWRWQFYAKTVVY